MKFKVDHSWIAYGLILIGIGLAVMNFLHFRSLWLDEAMLSLNIVKKPVLELFQPLDLYQVAPIGFLLLEKVIAWLFEYSDWSLRILPFISYLICIYLVYALTHKILKDQIFGLYTAAFFASTFNIIYYSSEVKQYMFDVMILLVILLATIDYSENNTKKKWWTYAIIGAVSVWFSNVAVILLFSCGLYTMFKTYITKTNESKHLIYILSVWVISFITYYALFIYNHPSEEYMVSFWRKANAFLPKDVFSADFYKTLGHNINAVCFKLFGVPSMTKNTLIKPFFLLGLFFLAKGKRDMLYLLTFPIILHLVLTYFQLYPFAKRLILYTYPAFLIIFFSGIYFTFSLVKQHRSKLLFLLPLIFAFNFIFIKRLGFPIEKEEIRSSMSYLNSKLKDNEKVYIYYGARPAFRFYLNDYNSIMSVDRKNLVYAYNQRKGWSKYDEIVSKLNGNSVWILFSHVWKNKNEENLNEEKYILNLFSHHGYKVVDEQQFKGSSIYYAIKK